ncbi:hypothetical protein FZ983_26255 [Azospirillum sp. B21]|uniref:hypothetical protein n=1 Tax=Azospirillum sp. B21 TaxID=2607496 RepID=UPI0011EEAEE7|nr:hypothetical protein [Azospirillum sp. B21]KAA0575162.1 hypothetical protein FZ983_26255 [Azospirillum sp. B21]
MPEPLDLDGLGKGAAPPPSQAMSRAERLESDDLTVVLGAFGRSDLDPLVKILVEREAGDKSDPLRECDAYKTGGGDHHRYIPQIVEEIRWWGSHDVLDAGELRSYRAVVANLCGKVEIPVTDTTSVFDMERLLVKERVDADKLGGSSLGDTVGSVLNAAGVGLGLIRAIGAVAIPVSVGIAAWTMWEKMGPDYKMTGQCVMAIAEARMRLWCAAMADEMEVVG